MVGESFYCVESEKEKKFIWEEFPMGPDFTRAQNFGLCESEDNFPTFYCFVGLKYDLAQMRWVLRQLQGMDCIKTVELVCELVDEEYLASQTEMRRDWKSRTWMKIMQGARDDAHSGNCALPNLRIFVRRHINDDIAGSALTEERIESSFSALLSREGLSVHSVSVFEI